MLLETASACAYSLSTNTISLGSGGTQAAEEGDEGETRREDEEGDASDDDVDKTTGDGSSSEGEEERADGEEAGAAAVGGSEEGERPGNDKLTSKFLFSAGRGRGKGKGKEAGSSDGPQLGNAATGMQEKKN